MYIQKVSKKTPCCFGTRAKDIPDYTLPDKVDGHYAGIEIADRNTILA